MSGRPIKRTLRRTAASGMPIIKRVLRISCADVGCSSSIIPAVRLPLACSSGSSRRSRCATGTRPGTSPRTGSPARAAGCSRRRSTCSPPRGRRSQPYSDSPRGRHAQGLRRQPQRPGSADPTGPPRPCSAPRINGGSIPPGSSPRSCGRRPPACRPRCKPRRRSTTR